MDIHYKRLAERLNALPNGFPPTDDGRELKLLAKIFTPEQAELAAQLTPNFGDCRRDRGSNGEKCRRFTQPAQSDVAKRIDRGGEKRWEVGIQVDAVRGRNLRDADRQNGRGIGASVRGLFPELVRVRFSRSSRSCIA